MGFATSSYRLRAASKKISNAVIEERVQRLRDDCSLANFGAVLDSYARSSQWEQAVATLSVDMARVAVKPDVFCIGAALNACAQSSATASAISLLVGARQSSIETNTVIFNTAVHACAQVGYWEGALHLLEEMTSSHVHANVITFTAAVSACKKGGKWYIALQLLTHPSMNEIKLDLVAYGAVLSTCEKGKQWAWALRLVQRLSSSTITPDATSISPAAAACASCSRWEHALSFLHDMSEKVGNPGGYAFNATVNACARGHVWTLALDVLRLVSLAMVPPSLETLKATSQLCEQVLEARCSGEILSGLRRSAANRILLSWASKSELKSTLRGELVAAVNDLQGRSMLDGTFGLRIWKFIHGHLVRELSRGVRRGATGNLEAGSTSGKIVDADRINHIHGRTLQGLFEIGDVCARGALQSAIHAGGLTDVSWCMQARSELHDKLVSSYWVARQSPAGVHLATWCMYDIAAGSLDGARLVLTSNDENIDEDNQS